jgi:hypothetical protein
MAKKAAKTKLQAKDLKARKIPKGAAIDIKGGARPRVICLSVRSA